MQDHSNFHKFVTIYLSRIESMEAFWKYISACTIPFSKKSEYMNDMFIESKKYLTYSFAVNVVAAK